MNNLNIVIAREYMTRVKKKSFLIITILMPFLMAAVVMVPVLFSMVKGDEKREVAIIDQTGKYMQLIIEAQVSDSTKSDGYIFIPGTEPLEYYRSEEATASAVLCITADLTEDPEACRIYSKGEVQHELQSYVENILGAKIRQDKLRSYDVPQLEDIISDVEKSFSIKTIKWTEDGGETMSSNEIAIMIGLVSSLLIYMFVMIYGAMVMQGVMEEKTNRIVEVIVGSVKPFQLMLGKIIGVMLVGFTQILIWGIMFVALTTIMATVFADANVASDAMQQAAMAGSPEQMALEAMNNNPVSEFLTILANLPVFEVIVFFILFFLGGYLLYASLYAAIGASVNSQEDSSQFMMPIVILQIIALYGAMGCMDNTDGPLAFWASLFPFTSPIVMMVRIPLGVPMWQELLSIAILFATALGSVWIGGRIYRVGILMYGKKPTFKEMIKWLRYK